MASAAAPDAAVERPEARFFREQEAASAPPAATDWQSALAAAHARELAFDPKGARAALDAFASEVPAGPFARVAELLRLRVAVREAKPEGLEDAVRGVRALLAALPAEERATYARAQQLLATAYIRLGRLEPAEEAIGEALVTIDGEVALVRSADTLGQVLIGQGAWVEAKRTLTALVARRRAMNDPIGVAISAGHLVRLDVQLGAAAEGAALAEEVLAVLDRAADVPLLTRLRMQTLLATALVEIVPVDPRLAPAAAKLEELARGVTEDTHYLRGYAGLTLARAFAALGDRERARAWLDSDSTRQFTLPVHVSLLRFHEAKIDPSVLDQPDWLAEQQKLWAQVDFVSEAEIESRILHARAAKDPDDRRERLERAYARAMESNNAVWMRLVDEAAAELEPALRSERLALRYSGRRLAELARTTRADATIIFADLVGFTPRSLLLTPEEVMDTVRGLFELGVPLLAKHKVQPLTYMGDGLLAIAQGDEHEKRGLAFARELVARCNRITRVRHALDSGLPLELRAGVASGTVVLGSLGSLFKTEFAAIGATTNLAARLQAQADPGQVICARRTAWAAGADDAADASFDLKGLGAVDASRIVVP
ncbi:MAG: adenylate/guanylate cyclase domain-containing protein [Labilithrix sp.]|nr:adenylate/guanylate cyclase domain-containing protein [Labilithrix sp.]MCW5815856.1 adenylate/guanylate cyclase domain-containing protein [Labilithrix sp.]